MILEICANSVASCIAAQEGGAQRIELCAGIPEGGTTPSYGMVKKAREAVSIGLYIIIRPRGGDFLYSPTEVEEMIEDIKIFKTLGVDGFVFGALTPDGEVDKEICKRLIEAAEGFPTTFHRAFDMAKDPKQALEDIIELGFERILTSGCMPNALEGVSNIAMLVREAQDRIAIMAGCGVNASNVHEIVQMTGVKEVHGSFRSPIESKMRYRNSVVSMGGTVVVEEYSTPQTDAEKVKEIINIIN
ncbi:MAG: copper homeostasis protein CutC [Porphyromonas sp.]|nr:copper homeostasis protein CutC [Porphyromonas sp.]